MTDFRHKMYYGTLGLYGFILTGLVIASRIQFGSFHKGIWIAAVLAWLVVAVGIHPRQTR